MTSVMRDIMQRRSLSESRAIKQHQTKASGEHHWQYFAFPGSRMGLRIDVIK